MRLKPFGVMWIAMLILTSACAAGPVPTDSYCALARPQTVRLPPREWQDRFMPDERPGDYDRLTATTARGIAAANEIGATQCRW